MFKKITYLAFLVIPLLLAGCKGRSAGNPAASPDRQSTAQTRKFKGPSVPGMLTEENRRLDYILTHFWDDFFSGEWKTDADMILGTKDGEVEQAVSNFIGFVMMKPVDVGQSYIAGLFDKIEKKQAENAESLFYLRMTEIVSRYLYDPNSPMRSEDLYMPFVKGMKDSEYTSDDLRSAYGFEYEKCLLNPYGSVAPDFKFKNLKGQAFDLHSIKAEYTMLFFSNPGCSACMEIINQIKSRNYIDTLIAGKNLAIINIYIDNELDKWRDYVGAYPENWYNCYDFEQIINTDQLYYVRAIPSIYLLDKDKRVLMKDAPVERVLNLLDSYVNDISTKNQ